jgi:pimeloyl-ACP methyl ester carboxylesterase
MKLIPVTIFFISLLVLSACNNPAPNTSMHTTKNYKEGFVESEKVKLHYIDWGGQGPVLLLLCGLGDTPFLFEEMAAQLSAHYRVIGYSRRYHGGSESKEEKYDNATLVSDLHLFLDSLKIEKASLLGWSMGGNEITAFATLYPEKVNKLIYFEAGYDLSDGGFEKLVSNIPRSYLPDNMVTKSLNNYRDWYHHFWFGDMEWNDALEANLQASVKIDSTGNIVTVPRDDVFKSILTEAMKYRRTYEKVTSPSLVIYTTPFLHPPGNDPVTQRIYDSIEQSIVLPWRTANKKRIREELRNATIVDAPKGSHTSFLFLSHEFLIKTIDAFLKDQASRD